MTLLAAIIAVSLTACGGSRKSDSENVTEDVEEQKSQLEQALSEGDIRHASAMADSMALFVDDFTPEQTVQVLTAFVTVHNDAGRRHESRRDLETLRKFVDVYDIALSVNPKDTRAAFDKAKRRNSALDFDSLAIAFRKKLSQYDSMQDGSLVGDREEETDSVATAADSVASSVRQDLPIELRPAE